MNEKRRLSTRRNFIKRAAVGAAGVFGMPDFVPHSAFGSATPSKRINVGCIGTGNMGFPVTEPDWASSDACGGIRTFLYR